MMEGDEDNGPGGNKTREIQERLISARGGRSCSLLVLSRHQPSPELLSPESGCHQGRPYHPTFVR